MKIIMTICLGIIGFIVILRTLVKMAQYIYKKLR